MTTNRPRNEGTPLRVEMDRGRARQSVRGGAAGRDAYHPPHRQEELAGWVAGEGDHLHRPDDVGRRRYSGPGGAALRLGQAWLILMKEELGNEWLEPDLFRIGASSMLGDIEGQLEHHATGRYSSAKRHAMA